mgnify:CR=1 FL=1
MNLMKPSDFDTRAEYDACYDKAVRQPIALMQRVLRERMIENIFPHLSRDYNIGQYHI